MVMMKANNKALIVFNLFHATVCFLVTILIFLIIGGDAFLEYPLAVKLFRVIFALFCLVGIIFGFRFIVLQYFVNYIDIRIILKITIYLSIFWFTAAAIVLKAVTFLRPR
jgi:hypothetical protein